MAILVSGMLFASCSLLGTTVVSLWTDVPAVAIYAELFNSTQTKVRVEVLWKDSLAQSIRDSESPPDMAIGAWLQSAVLRGRFKQLDYLFGELALDKSAFYPALLEAGNEEGHQILIPLSFDLPAIAFKGGGAGTRIAKDIIGIGELEQESRSFDSGRGTSYAKIGFSPRWDPDFLVLSCQALGAGFKEGKPLLWSALGLRASVERLSRWNSLSGPGPAAADEFQFKYLYAPAYSWLTDGRVEFAYLPISALLTLPRDKSSALDWRWYGEAGRIPVLPDTVFVGLPRSRKRSAPAESFLAWLYNAKEQQQLLEMSRRSRVLESTFGIANGFSALRSVTESVFPLYYESLKGHLPDPASLRPGDPLPPQWSQLKSDVIGPWLREAVASTFRSNVDYGAQLEAQVQDWIKNGRNRQ